MDISFNKCGITIASNGNINRGIQLIIDVRTPYETTSLLNAILESWVEISKIVVDLDGTRDISKTQKQMAQSKAIEFSIQQDLYNVIYSIQ